MVRCASPAVRLGTEQGRCLPRSAVITGSSWILARRIAKSVNWQLTNTSIGSEDCRIRQLRWFVWNELSSLNCGCAPDRTEQWVK
jgi:hypothetical protein